MHKSKVLVTGGAGFIGSHVCEDLLRKMYEVAVFDNFSTGKESNLSAIKNKIEIIKGDIRNKNELSLAMKGVDYVIHLAAMVSVLESMQNPAKCREINIEGTKNVLDAALRNHVQRIVIASSAAVYGNAVPPIKETMECKPLSQYGESKLQNERDATSQNMGFASDALGKLYLRYFNIYGPRQDPNSPYSGVIAKFILAAKKGEAPKIFGDGRQTRDFIYVKDVATATVMAMENEASMEAINIATGKPTSINQLFEEIKKIAKSTARPRYEPARPGDIKYSYADVSKSRKLLNFSPRYSLEEGLKETMEQT